MGDGGLGNDLVAECWKDTDNTLDGLNLLLPDFGELLQESSIVPAGEGPHRLAEAVDSGGAKFSGQVGEGTGGEGIRNETSANVGKLLQACWEWGWRAVGNVQDSQPHLDSVTVEPDVRENDGSINVLGVVDVEFHNGINERRETTSSHSITSSPSPNI